MWGGPGTFPGSDSAGSWLAAPLATAQDPGVGEGTERCCAWSGCKTRHEEETARGGSWWRGPRPSLTQVPGPKRGPVPRRRDGDWKAAWATHPAFPASWARGGRGWRGVVRRSRQAEAGRGVGPAALPPLEVGPGPVQGGDRAGLPALAPMGTLRPCPEEAGVRQMHAGRGGERGRGGEEKPHNKTCVAERTAGLEWKEPAERGGASGERVRPARRGGARGRSR